MAADPPFPQDAGPVYSVVIGWEAAQVSRVTFAEAIEFLRVNIWRALPGRTFQAYNDERYDGAPDTRNPDGLTDEEREAIDEAAEVGEVLYCVGLHRAHLVAAR